MNSNMLNSSNRRRLAGLALAASLALAAPLVAQAADFSDWNKQMEIRFAGYTKPETLTNFPVLVVLGTNISGFGYNQFQSGTNADLRFTDAGGATELNYEIDTWNTNGLSYAWVQVPALTNNASIRAFWWKSGQTAPSYTTNGATWTNGFIAVYHMNQTNALDSTSNHLNAAANGNVVATNSGIAAGGLYFPGATGDRLTITGLPANTPDYTIQLWLDYRGNTSEKVLWEKWGSVDSLEIWNNYFGEYNQNNATPQLVNGNWYQLVYRQSSSENLRKLFVNGQVGRSDSVYHNSSTNTSARICEWSGGGYAINGYLDEIQVSSVARSSNWLWTAWFNMTSNRLFASNSTIQTLLGEIRTDLPTNVTGTSACLNGYLVSTGASDTAVLVYWGATDGGIIDANWATNGVFAAPWSMGPFSTNVTVTGGAEYFYRYAASNAAGVAWATNSHYFITTNVTLAVTPGVVSESNEVATFSFMRSASVTGGPLTVYFTLGGTARNGLDYNAINPSNITLAAGATSVTLQVTTIWDAIPDPNETLDLIITNGPYVPGGAPVATLTITEVRPINGYINAPFAGGSSDGYSRWNYSQFATNALPLLAARNKGGGYDGYNFFLQANTTIQTAYKGTIYVFY